MVISICLQLLWAPDPQIPKTLMFPDPSWGLLSPCFAPS